MNKMTLYIHRNKRLLPLIIIIFTLLIIFGCTKATETLYLYDEKDHASLKTTKDIYIVKIDNRIVNIKFYGEKGTKYSRVTIKPGRREIAVQVPWFREGSVFFVEAYFVAGREYIVKYKVGDRVSLLSRAWHCKVWIEDAISGDIVSKMIRNI